jgi:AcrR family transcriptional regulator
VQDLMEAAEAMLATKSAREITIREIAQKAGTDDAMIHYYFGGKDQLMISLIREVSKTSPHNKSKEIIQECILHRSIQPLVSAITSHQYSRPNLIRMIIVEISSKDSGIRSLYEEEIYSDPTLMFIRDAIENLSACGIYRNNINVDFAITALMGMISAPTIILYSGKALNISDKMNDSEWVNYVASAIDLTLKPGL